MTGEVKVRISRK